MRKNNFKKAAFFLFFFFLFNVSYGFLCKPIANATTCLMNCCSAKISAEACAACCSFGDKGSQSVLPSTEMTKKMEGYAGAPSVVIGLDDFVSVGRFFQEPDSRFFHSPPIYILKQSFRI